METNNTSSWVRQALPASWTCSSLYKYPKRQRGNYDPFWGLKLYSGTSDEWPHLQEDKKDGLFGSRQSFCSPFLGNVTHKKMISGQFQNARRSRWCFITLIGHKVSRGISSRENSLWKHFWKCHFLIASLDSHHIRCFRMRYLVTRR